MIHIFLFQIANMKYLVHTCTDFFFFCSVFFLDFVNLRMTAAHFENFYSDANYTVKKLLKFYQTK